MPKNKMNIADIQYSIETASIEIYLAGCNPPHCHGCHNEALWNFNAGLPWDYWLNGLIENYRFMGSLVQHIWVLGGEPLDQPQYELVGLLTALRKHFDKPIWLFTRHNIGQIPCEVLKLCDYVKTGRYKEEMGPGVEEYGVLMATANQHVTKVVMGEVIYVDFGGTNPSRVTITQERYESLLKSEAELTALENYGVDNWHGYSDAMSDLYGDEDDDGDN